MHPIVWDAYSKGLRYLCSCVVCTSMMCESCSLHIEGLDTCARIADIELIGMSRIYFGTKQGTGPGPTDSMVRQSGRHKPGSRTRAAGFKGKSNWPTTTAAQLMEAVVSRKSCPKFFGTQCSHRQTLLESVTHAHVAIRATCAWHGLTFMQLGFQLVRAYTIHKCQAPSLGPPGSTFVGTRGNALIFEASIHKVSLCWLMIANNYNLCVCCVYMFNLLARHAETIFECNQLLVFPRVSTKCG